MENPAIATVTRLTSPAFGHVLRKWRLARRWSQLDLALEAGISSRHLSFLETGRAQPSRDMVVRLSQVLDVPLQERNSLLLAAGYAPAYAETPLTAPELEPIQRALQYILHQQEPYPACVVDGVWNVVQKNDAAQRIFALLMDQPLPPDLARNAMHALFHPQGIRRYVTNWEECSGAMIERVHREAGTGNEASQRLLKDLLAYPGIPSPWHTPDLSRPLPPLFTVRLRKGDQSFAFFTTLATLGTPQDVTLQQLRIESFFPADLATEAATRRLAQESAAV
jgi:transcriptional regulator with XRE-family HTH domain